jgi:hypothetical protein
MKFVKTLSILSGTASLLLAGLAPLSASALSTASITMDADTSTNGHFSVVVYEDTGADTVTGANVVLTFNQAVSDVSYDYSVGPFTAVTPSGAHNAYGTVTGRNALARVSFTGPVGTTIADVATDSSYLKHVEGTTIQNFAFNAGEAYYTYTVPAPVQRAAATPVATAPAVTTPAVTDTPASISSAKTAQDVKGVQASTTKPTKSSHVGLVSSTVVLVVLAAAAAYWLLIHRRPATEGAKAYKLDAATKSKPAKKKPAVAHKAGKKPAARKK